MPSPSKLRLVSPPSPEEIRADDTADRVELKRARRACEATIEAFARVLGVCDDTLCNYESGKTRIPARVMRRARKLIELVCKEAA